MSDGVAIFRFELGLPSETFIPEQAAALSRYLPAFWGRERKGPAWGQWKHHVADRWGSRAGKLFSLFPSIQFFDDREALERARLIHAHFGPDATYALRLAKSAGLPLVSTFHGYDVLTDRDKLARLGGLRLKHFFRNEALLKTDGARFIAVSEHVGHALIRHGYPESRIVKHYIGVDVAKFSPLSSADDYVRTGPFFLSVARHVEFKGIPTVLRAFAKFAAHEEDVRLIQVGTGPLLEKHQQLASQLGIAERVEFMGAVPHETVRQLMRTTLAFCGPSQTASDGGGEALGIVFCEASASGVPVLATKHGGIPEVVLDGETGILVNERDDAALGDAMAIVAKDASFRARLGAAGRRRMVESFNVRLQARLLEAIYDAAG